MEWIKQALAIGADSLEWWQIVFRAAVVYLAALVMVRIGGSRHFIGKYAAFDVVLSIMLGATLSRAINGSAPFFGTLIGSFALVSIHRLLATLSYRSGRLEQWIKGEPYVIIQNGEIRPEAMKSHNISHKDLKSALCSQGLEHFDQIKQARLESSGAISILTQDSPPQVVDVSVEAGVQTVRIQLN